MIINTITLTIITIAVMLLSELFTKKIAQKLFPVQLKKIKETEKKLKDLKNLIRLTMLNNDNLSYKKLQSEYAEHYNSIFFTKIRINSIFIIPLLVFIPLASFAYNNQALLLPAINLIFFVAGIYFLVKFIISLVKNFYGK
jgi:hypothetical protein